MASGSYAINSVKNILPTTILKTMYYSMVHPYLPCTTALYILTYHVLQHGTSLLTMYYSMVHLYLTYGLLLWGSTYKRHINKIEIMHKCAIRSVAKAKYNEQTLQLFISLSILKLNDLFNLQMAVFKYEYNMDILPLWGNALHEMMSYMTKTPDIVEILILFHVDRASCVIVLFVKRQNYGVIFQINWRKLIRQKHLRTK